MKKTVDERIEDAARRLRIERPHYNTPHYPDKRAHEERYDYFAAGFRRGWEAAKRSKQNPKLSRGSLGESSAPTPCSDT